MSVFIDAELKHALQVCFYWSNGKIQIPRWHFGKNRVDAVIGEPTQDSQCQTFVFMATQ